MLAALVSLAVQTAAPLALRVDVGDAIPSLRAVSPAFVGLSIEPTHVLQMLREGNGDKGDNWDNGDSGAAAPRAALAQALRNLHSMTAGPHEGPTLRIGGNTQDSACWHAASTWC